MSIFTHCVPVDLSEFLQQDDIVDNLTTPVTNKVLSANQGVVLKALIDAKAEPVSMSVVGTNVELVLDNGDKVIMDATQLLLDIKSMSGRYDEPTQSIIITLSDNNSFSIPVANLLPVVTDDTIDGNGSGVPLGVAISTDADNTITRGGDGKLYSRKERPSTEARNGLTMVDDKFYLEVLDDEDLHQDSHTAVPTQHSVKTFVETKFHNRLFLQKTGWVLADIDHPTTNEVEAKVPSTFRNGIVYYNKTDNDATEPTHTWWIDDQGEATPLGSQSNNPDITTSDMLIGQIFYDTDNTPTDGKLFQGNTYQWSNNPKLKTKFDANGHEFITDNGDGTFSISSHNDFVRAGLTDIGKHVDDTTATNGLHNSTEGNHRHSYPRGYDGGGGTTYVHRAWTSDGVTGYTSTNGNHSHTITGDAETAPDHRKAYFGIYGDLAIIVAPSVTANYTVVNSLSNRADEVPTTHAVTAAMPDKPVIAQVIDYKHTAISSKSISGWAQIANSFELYITPRYSNSKFRVRVQWFGESANTENCMVGLGVNSDTVNIEGDRAITMPTKTYDYQINNSTTPEIAVFEYIYTSTTAAGGSIRFVPLMKYSNGENRTVQTNRTLGSGHAYNEAGISTIIIEEIRV